MTTIEILHNVSRNASFGLNVSLIADSSAEHGYTRHEATAAEPELRHPLIKVFEYELDAPSFTSLAICEQAFELFNIGTAGPALAYRARKLRSLSVGDVVTLNGWPYSCESLGFRPRTEAELNKIIDFNPTEIYGEPMVTVPWANTMDGSN